MRRLAISAVLALGLATSACEDDSGVRMGPGGDLNGTWVVQRATGTTYIRILPSTAEMYVETDTCFEKTVYGIQEMEDVSFTVVPLEQGQPAGSAREWTLERVDDQLTVIIDGEAFTLEASTESVGQLEVCGGPEPYFPIPGCTNIPSIAIGGTGDGALGEGDAGWPSDGTWYDLWSLQLATAQTVTITMTSEDTSLLDPYLLLYPSIPLEGEDIDQNDDIDDANFNARIGPIDLEAGCYIIVAGSWEGDDEGEVGAGYTVSVE